MNDKCGMGEHSLSGGVEQATNVIGMRVRQQDRVDFRRVYRGQRQAGLQMAAPLLEPASTAVDEGGAAATAHHVPVDIH
jgi:hypothetical protein